MIKVWKAENIKIEKARWGRFKIIHEKGFVELSKDSDPTKLSLEEIKKLNEQSRLAEEQFKKLTQKQYDPDLEKGLGYLAGFTKETI